MKYKNKSGNDEEFIIFPKIDFAFKLLFGDEKNKDLLIGLLSVILRMPEKDFKDIQILNGELLREFQEDKKGILDEKAKTAAGKQINIEIQILPTDFMPQRTIYYWSKMYSSQAKSGDTYDVLKKCITINIVDFVCTPINELHTSYHITEDNSGERLTDILEIHFLELPKLWNGEINRDEEDPIVQWMEFLDGKSREVMEMLANKNETINKAYDLLKVISKDEKNRMIYEAREAQIKDELTRVKVAREEGRYEERLEIAKKLLDVLDVETISLKTELPISEIMKLKQQ